MILSLRVVTHRQPVEAWEATPKATDSLMSSMPDTESPSSPSSSPILAIDLDM